MTDPSDEMDRQIADEVLPALIDDLARPAPLDKLLPWHRPRKQLVREEQWLRYSRDLLRNQRGKPGLSSPDGSSPDVRYLTLPGIDYLDVQQLAALCRCLDCSLTSVGFQSGDEGSPQIARAQVREKSLIDAGHITRQSHTFPRRFEDIIHRESQAFRDLRRQGPFHIVNIDACGSIARPAAGHASRLVDALYRVAELQFELKAGRWLLLVTTDARPDSVAETTLARLCDAIFSNAETNEDFRILATPLLDPAAADIRAAAELAAKKTGASFLRLFSLGLAKWLLDLAHSKNWDMKTHHPYCYSTMRGPDITPSMACLAFEFLPPSPRLADRFEVVHAVPAPEPEREDTSVRAAEQVRRMTNADIKIEEDEPLRLRMTENLRRSLQEAGYPTAVLEQLGD